MNWAELQYKAQSMDGEEQFLERKTLLPSPDNSFKRGPVTSTDMSVKVKT